jgi:SAM-dependent methyltransferase
MGPCRVLEVARECHEHLGRFTSIQQKIYFDLGCGREHPFGTSAVMFLNGCDGCLGIDLDPLDIQRVSEALFDLLVDCLIRPERWHWGQNSRDDFLKRLGLFDLAALQTGDLATGMKLVPMHFQLADISTCTLAGSGRIGLMSSRAVLEHVMDFAAGLARMMDMLAPGGVAYHSVDLTDHRWYGDPVTYHHWSHLAEAEDWTGGSVNRLRACEITEHFQAAGFEVLWFSPNRKPMPPGFRRQMRGRFAAMPEEELEIIDAGWVVRKPA